MKLATVLLSALACAASARAQYFSAGWNPGQPAPGFIPGAHDPSEPKPPPPVADFDRAPPPAQPPAAEGAAKSGGLADLFDMNRILTSGPVSGLFAKFGMNVTEAVERSKTRLWDPRVPLLTDENFEDVVVREELSDDEAARRVWMVIISVSSGAHSAISQAADKAFDTAYNETLNVNDLPDVRWARIDYLDVTYLTTKWAVWTGPFLLVITDRGQSLRFYKANHLRLTPELLRDFLKEESWRNSAPWETSFAPGGSNEWFLHYYATTLKYVFDRVNKVPRFVLMIASGGVASVLMRLLHKPKPKTAAEAIARARAGQTANNATGPAPVATPAAAPAAVATGASTTGGGAKGGKRKGGRK